MYTRRVALVLGLVLVGFGAFGESAEDYWPTWRGPNLDGVAVQGDPPVEWSETKNIKWKVAFEGESDSTPVIWGDKIFIQTAVASKKDTEAKIPKPVEGGREIFTPTPTVSYTFKIVCLNREDGATLWERTVAEAVPQEGRHPSTSFAPYSPVTDGKLLWASFGSRGLHCYDLDGNHKWSTDLIPMLTFRAFGGGSSPALAGDAIIVLSDHEGDSKIFAFNKDTGDLIWEKDRDESTSWGTPLPVRVGDSHEVVTSAAGGVRSYDLATGELLWHCAGLSPLAIPTPVTGFGKVFCMTGDRKAKLLAIELGRKGDLEGTDAIAWELDKGAPFVSSPMLYGERLYFTENMRPFLSCYDARTGAPIYERQRLTGLKPPLYGSPVGAAGRVYIADRKGTTIVVKDSDMFEILATNTLEETFNASPVVVGDALYLKGDSHIYCIAKP